MSTPPALRGRAAGLAALYLAAAYVAAMLYFLVGTGQLSVTDPAAKVDLLVAHQLGIHLMYLVAYLGFGLVLVSLVLGLHTRLTTAAPTTASVATAVGLIWAGLCIASGMVYLVGMGSVVDLRATDPAAAVAAWQAIEPVSNALGGTGAELLGGTWTLLVSLIALRARFLPRWLNGLGVVVGTAGIASTIPGLALGAGILFGLLQIAWFAGVGIVLLRDHPTAAPQPRTSHRLASAAG